MSERIVLDALSALRDRLENFHRSGRILLMTHERPDGDAIGSLCGLYFILRESGFFVDAVLPDSVPDMYQGFLPGGFLSSVTPEGAECYDLIIFLDCANQARCSVECFKQGALPRPTISIDHHPDNTRFADVNFVNDKASATSEILVLLAKEASWMISPASATFLLLGIITDTGCFRFDNSTPTALRAAARLMELGAARAQIIEKCYLTKPENAAMMESELLCSHLKKACDGKFAYAYISPELLKKYSVDVRNTEAVIDSIRQLEGITACAVIRRDGETFKASLRSKDPAISVGNMARAAGGGGHEMASGCTLAAATIEEAEKILVNLAETEFHKNA